MDGVRQHADRCCAAAHVTVDDVFKRWAVDDRDDMIDVAPFTAFHFVRQATQAFGELAVGDRQPAGWKRDDFRSLVHLPRTRFKFGFALRAAGDARRVDAASSALAAFWLMPWRLAMPAATFLKPGCALLMVLLLS